MAVAELNRKVDRGSRVTVPLVRVLSRGLE